MSQAFDKRHQQAVAKRCAELDHEQALREVVKQRAEETLRELATRQDLTPEQIEAIRAALAA
jgi:predicted DNA binding protein